MIRGFFVGESPYLRAVVTIPRLNAPSVRVDFVLDTGAAVSIIHRQDANAMGWRSDPTLARRTDRYMGVGGGVEYEREDVVVSVTNADGSHGLYRFVFRVGASEEARMELPSVLGMDFISNFRLTVSYRESRVALEPLFESRG